MEQNSSQMPGGVVVVGGGGVGFRSCRQRSFLSELDNFPIFVCFLSIPSYAGEIFDHDYLDL